VSLCIGHKSAVPLSYMTGIGVYRCAILRRICTNVFSRSALFIERTNAIPGSGEITPPRELIKSVFMISNRSYRPGAERGQLRRQVSVPESPNESIRVTAAPLSVTRRRSPPGRPPAAPPGPDRPRSRSCHRRRRRSWTSASPAHPPPHRHTRTRGAHTHTNARTHGLGHLPPTPLPPRHARQYTHCTPVD
jgi:hypothetical protein